MFKQSFIDIVTHWVHACVAGLFRLMWTWSCKCHTHAYLLLISCVWEGPSGCIVLTHEYCVLSLPVFIQNYIWRRCHSEWDLIVRDSFQGDLAYFLNKNKNSVLITCTLTGLIILIKQRKVQKMYKHYFTRQKQTLQGSEQGTLFVQYMINTNFLKR